MIEVKKKRECCGCQACAQICPKKCIYMKEDEEGFWYPEADMQACVNCKLCEQVCPVQNTESNQNHVSGVYVTYAKDEELRQKSSSGGIFSLCADYILQQGGVVFGAAFDDAFMVHHIAVEQNADLDLLRGSKYLQSRIENTYAEAEQYLKNGRKVLFTGTACQIAGLKAYLRKEYKGLYTLDILCHGVPSPKLWRHYLQCKMKENGSDIRKIFFRDKMLGWKKFSMKIEFLNEHRYESVFTKDDFMTLFLSNICLRPSCYHCGFKDIPRVSDVTIGDCWGIENYMPDMDDDKGTSLLVVNSEKGEELFQAFRDCILYQTAELDKALSPAADSRKSVAVHPNRKKFFKLLHSGKSSTELMQTLQLNVPARLKRKVRYLLRKYHFRQSDFL